MFVGRKYSLWMTVNWTRRFIFLFIIIATVPTTIFYLTDWKWMILPTLPLSLVGVAVAFNIGFKNNNSYERLWEARKIWGGIVNASRSWGIMSLDFVGNTFRKELMSDEELAAIHSRLIHRHVAWITALRFQLRVPKPWEHFHLKEVQKWRTKSKDIPNEHSADIRESLKCDMPEDELEEALGKANAATHIIRLQSKELKQLRDKNLIDDFRHMELQNMLNEFYALQGKSERIKNFPLPRQYASISLFFVWLFILILPFGLISSFLELGHNYVWLNIPCSVVISWVFFTMERIGDYSENPFEGLSNDVPITSLSRTIEIDLKEMLDEKHIPNAITPKNNILS